MKFIMGTLTASLAFWGLYELQFTNYPAFGAIVGLYALYGAVWVIREQKRGRGQ